MTRAVFGNTKRNLTKIKKVLAYCPETGLFTWLCPRFKSNLIGTIAGYQMPVGYLQVKVWQRKYYLHRLAWEFTHGPIPKDRIIDHINRIKNDNRLCNLRLANGTQNGGNCHFESQNTTTGIRNISHYGKEYIRVRVKDRSRYVRSLGAAIKLRDEMVKEAYGEFAVVTGDRHAS